MGEAGRGFSSAAPALALPRMLGRRILLKLAARGGMGDVYLAATTGIEGAERPCIVKTVRRDHIHDGSFLARFLDEARVQAQLQHPGVAQVLEAATDEVGEPFTVVEYVEGRSLSDVRQRALQVGVRIEWPDAVAVAIEIAQALAHVHERPGSDGTPLGIVHRDLSPQNVMVGYAGEVKLIDFGTARGHNRRCRTVAGVVFAKPGYVAPEVARQQVGDGRIDVYALGVILWELCAGRRFLTGDAQRHLDDAALGKVVVPPLSEATGAPRELDAVLQKLMQNDPDERYTRAALAVPELAKVLSKAPAVEGQERGVRARLALLMHKLWPAEPGRSRLEFARLLREACETLGDGKRASETPRAGSVSEGIASRTGTEDPSQVLGTPYRLLRKIGEGASGVVWEAEHVELSQRVALKVLAAEHASSQAALERFRREARSAAKLSHPNLVRILDFGKSLDGRVYLAMELCAGETLDTRLRRGPIPWREAVSIAVEATKALEAAHSAGLVHRDIKPQNLMLTAGDGTSPASPGRGLPLEVKLLDFGVATALAPATEVAGRAARKARENAGLVIFGTPEYMAPEQVAGEPVDGRADVYALGCVLYEMLTGERAFDGPSSVIVMGKQLRETPLPPRAKAQGLAIPASLEELVMRAMAKQPSRRWPSARDMRQALERTLAAPEKRRIRVRRALAAVTMATCTVVAAGASAQWARTHAMVFEGATLSPSSLAPLPSAATSLAMTSLPGPTEAPSAAPPPLAIASVSASPAPGLRDARASARSRPGDPRALETWTRAALRAGELREARRAVNAWILRDGTVEPRLVLSSVLEGMGRKAEARTVLAEWLESHPDSGDARLELARLSGEASGQLARK